MKKLFLLAAMAFALALAGCTAGPSAPDSSGNQPGISGTVVRGLSSSMVPAGQDLVVTLKANVGTQTFYAIDEIPPEGWTIKDAGQGSIDAQGHLKWLVLEKAATTTYTYVLTAPAEKGSFSFSGKCMFEGQAAEQQIKGATNVTVS
ncbi:MAG: hypothetical protein PHH08_00300 [Candidatus ainarchaeum sp.]|nr:hypothetical protein [Candidatus ainarchaeum sp.]